jgi:HK97 family phage prohead protease
MEAIYKEAVSDPGPNFEFVLSDATVDSYGDIVDPNGWELSRFRKNPIALFGHSHKDPIGTWADVRVEGGKLKGRLMFAKEGTSARIDELRRLVEQRILRAVSVGFRALEAEPIDPKLPWAGTKYKKQELLETSLVSVPANPAALSQAKSLNISSDTLKMVFGEHAMSGPDFVRRGARSEHAERNSYIGNMNMENSISKRIEVMQNDLVAKKDRLSELNAADALDIDAIEELNAQIKAFERALKAMKESEANIGINTTNTGVAAPAVARRPLGFPQKQISGLDLLVRKGVVRGLSYFGEKSIDQVLDERYPGHEATAAVAKAAAPLGTTSGSHFVDDLQQTSYQGFMDALDGRSIFPELRTRGMGINFDQAGTAYIPGVTAGGANGSFFSEGSPMRVGRITTNSSTMTSRKAGVIIPFSREAAKRSTPNLEQLVRRRIIADTAAILDSHLLDATAEDSVRPGGLLYGVSAAGTGYGGGDYQAVIEDINAVIAPFDDANASDGLILIMHPQQRRKLAMTPGPDGTFGWADKFLAEFTVVASTHATKGRLIAVRVEDLATALGDAPEFEISNSATIHMEDTSPAALSAAGTPNTVAAPIRSFFQTDSIGIRMVMDVNWKMIRSGMVQWINGTTW